MSFRWFSNGSCFLVELKFAVWVFVERIKPEYQEKNRWSKVRTNNKLGMFTIKGPQ